MSITFVNQVVWKLKQLQFNSQGYRWLNNAFWGQGAAFLSPGCEAECIAKIIINVEGHLLTWI